MLRPATRKDLYALAGLLSLFLVLSNFVLDLFRKRDFATEKVAIQSQLEQLALQSDDIDVLATAISGRGKRAERHFLQLEGILSSLDQVFEKLLLLTSTTPTSADTSTSADTRTEPNANTTDDSDELTLENIFGAPISRLLEELDQVASVPTLEGYFSTLPPAAKWNAAQIVADLKSRFNLEKCCSISHETLLRHKISAYQNAIAFAKSRFQSRLDQSILERTKTGDYESPNEFGQFPRKAVVSRETIAVLDTGHRRFMWKANEYPELHRLSLIKACLPMVMLRDVSASLLSGERRPP